MYLTLKVTTADGFVWCLDQKLWSFRTSGMKAKMVVFDFLKLITLNQAKEIMSRLVAKY